MPEIVKALESEENSDDGEQTLVAEVDRGNIAQ